MSDEKQDAKLAAAEAKAAKAKAKALRPWFKKKRVIVPAVILLLIIGRAVMGGSDDSNTSSNSDTNSSSSDNNSSTETTLASLGEAVTDGDFTFTVSDVSCGHSSVGSDVLGKEAQGQYCLVHLSIENVGKEAKTLYGDSQKLYDSEGREFSPDSTAAIYLGDEGSTIWEEINPGNTLQGTLVYDVPKGVTLEKLALHDNMYSTGVEVSVK